MHSCRIFLLLVWLSPFSRLCATTIIPFKHLGEAAQAGDAVVLAVAEKQLETAADPFVFFDCRFRVQSAAKGGLQPGASFILRQHSHRLGDFTGTVAGDFVPQEGQAYLLFLQRNGDVWRPVTLSYYVYETKNRNGEVFLVPLEESAGIELATRSDGAKPEPPGVYRPHELLEVLRQYAGGKKPVWDATPALTAYLPSDFPAERALPAGCDFSLPGAPQSRWQNAAVQIYFDDTNAPANFSGTLDAILGSMNGSYTGIDPTNGGQVSFTPDCSDGAVTGNDFTTFLTGLNGLQATLIFFEDPCNQIPNLSGCAGTLAIGGSYVSSTTHSYKGDTWNNALWGFVVVNNGVPACLDPDEYEIMLTHELTHTYQMDHLNAGNYPNQNMNPSCCNTINTKDIECMNYTYDLPAPVELTAFDAQPYPEHRVRVSWATASERDNDHFDVERSKDGKQFETLAQLPGTNTSATRRYEWIDLSPSNGLNYYRLSQVDFNGQTSTFGMKAVTVGTNDAAFRVSPNPAPATEITVSIELPAAFQGVMEIVTPDGRILDTTMLTLEKGVNTVEQSVAHFAPGMYWLRLRQTNSVQVSKFFIN